MLPLICSRQKIGALRAFNFAVASVLRCAIPIPLPRLDLFIIYSNFFARTLAPFLISLRLL